MSYFNRVYSPYDTISAETDGYLGNFLSIKMIPLRIIISLLPFIIVFVPLHLSGVTVSPTVIAVLISMWIVLTLTLWWILRFLVIKFKEVTETIFDWDSFIDLEWIFGIVRFPAITWLMLFDLLFRRHKFKNLDDFTEILVEESGPDRDIRV